jgi:hypothetical protein
MGKCVRPRYDIIGRADENHVIGYRRHLSGWSQQLGKLVQRARNCDWQVRILCPCLYMQISSFGLLLLPYSNACFFFYLSQW